MDDLKRQAEVFTDPSSCKTPLLLLLYCYLLSELPMPDTSAPCAHDRCFVALEARRKATESIKDSQELWHTRVSAHSLGPPLRRPHQATLRDGWAQ